MRLFKEIIKKLEEYEGNICSVGVRGLQEGQGLGSLENSREWEDGELTDIELDGTSCIVVSSDYNYEPEYLIEENIEKYAKEVLDYADENGIIGLVVGQLAEGGTDIGEIVIPEAVCIHTWTVTEYKKIIV